MMLPLILLWLSGRCGFLLGFSMRKKTPARFKGRLESRRARAQGNGFCVWGFFGDAPSPAAAFETAADRSLSSSKVRRCFPLLQTERVPRSRFLYDWDDLSVACDRNRLGLSTPLLTSLSQLTRVFHK